MVNLVESRKLDMRKSEVQQRSTESYVHLGFMIITMVESRLLFKACLPSASYV